jgi:hypothetical protein
MKLLALASTLPLLMGSGSGVISQAASKTEYVDPTAEQRVVQFNANRACAILSDIPYQKAHVKTEKWEEFVSCMQFMRDINGITY